MVGGVALQKTSTGWGFVSEAALEQFLWTHLEPIFELTPLKRQYIASGEVCDILAVDRNKGLVILELKNSEDRYLIQQLTRYYANLLEAKPFQAEIDYSRSVRLVAIAPSYHRHNLIDQGYSQLNFELFQFSICEEEGQFEFVLQLLVQESVQIRHPLPYHSIQTPWVEGIADPPELLLKWLGGCTPEEQKGFLRIRSKILSCHPRMKEIVDKRLIRYGSGQTKLCAEFYYQQKTQRPILFLWLPTPMDYVRSRDPLKKLRIGRLRLWTNGQTISHVGYVPEGLGKMITKLEWEQLAPEKRPRLKSYGLTQHSSTPVEIEIYLGCRKIEIKPDFWEALSDLAIEEWMKKIS